MTTTMMVTTETTVAEPSAAARPVAPPSDDEAYAALVARDPRFDGWLVAGVLSTGIYCRPSCPAPVRPKRRNVRFFPTSAAAHAAGLRACKRCRPDAVPGSPAWDARADLVARAMRLIGDGLVDRDGVAGLARHLHVTPRHLRRCVQDELGATPRAIARARRAERARTLVEATDLPFGELAYAAGFGSLRQFNDTFREVYAATPTQLRATARRSGQRGDETRGDGSVTAIDVRLGYRPPLAFDQLLDWFASQAVEGLEDVGDDHYTRALVLPHGPGVVRVERPGPADATAPRTHHVSATFHLTDLRDLAAAVERTRRLLDLDADPRTVDDALATDALLASLVDATRGVRIPGAVHPIEGVARTVLAQQISLAAARTHLHRLVATHGRPLPGGLTAATGLTNAFPTAECITALSDADLRLPASRATTLRTVVGAVAAGQVDLGPGADRDAAAPSMLALKGIGPWTSDCVRLLTLRDPDVLPVGDLVLRRRAEAIGLPGEQRALAEHARRWSPWAGYAAMHLWHAELLDRAPRTTTP